MKRSAPPSPATPPTAVPDRKEQLRQSLPAAVELLKQRQAHLIAASEIDEYVDLQWLEWQGGTLKLTVTGTNVCSQTPRARR